MTRNSRPPQPGDALTDRELEVLRAAARGLTNPQIGAELWLSRNTIKTHMHRACIKLGAHTRTQAVYLAHRRIVATEQSR